MYSFTLPQHSCLSLKHVRGSCLWINYNFSLCSCWNIYRVIHKSVKHFKNSQQMNYSTDHGSSYADRKRNSPSSFYIFRRCSMCPTLVIWQTSMRKSISFHTRVSISRPTRATAAVIRLRKSGD